MSTYILQFKIFKSIFYHNNLQFNYDKWNFFYYISIVIKIKGFNEHTKNFLKFPINIFF